MVQKAEPNKTKVMLWVGCHATHKPIGKVIIIPTGQRGMKVPEYENITLFLVVDHLSVCHPLVTTQNFMESSHSVLVVLFQGIQVSIQMLLDSEAG